MIHTGMTLEQAISLEPVFSKMQPNGQWSVPEWLQQLERDIASRDLIRDAITVGKLGTKCLNDYYASIDQPSREG